MLNKFKDFMADYNGFEMYVTGAAGTGKTTSLSVVIEYCMAEKIPYVVCAYTHKACGILATKLPAKANIQTLHTFLTKRPTINILAKAVEHLEVSRKQGVSKEYEVMFLDEYSMIGERDYRDIGVLQNPTSDKPDAPPSLRVVYIGDSNQLPPVGDQAAVFPRGDYKVELTKVYRQAGDNKLLDTLGSIIKLMNGDTSITLEEHDTFKRGCNLTEKYKPGDILLAYTNERVEELNREVAKKHKPEVSDNLYSPTLRMECVLRRVKKPHLVYSINKAYGEDVVDLGSKYKTLEHLVSMQCCEFYDCSHEQGAYSYAVIFGHYQYKLVMQKYAAAAAAANNNIPADNAKLWCINNKNSALAKARAKAWRNYLTFKECVVCMDFPYATTVHKSQGSTYDTVLLDTNDLYKCAERDYGLYLKLMYVGISRASNKVYTS